MSKIRACRPCCCSPSPRPSLAACGELRRRPPPTRRSRRPSRSATARRTQLETMSRGRSRSATDKPAYPPYFEDNDPTNGKGFESATAYAIADQLGFSPDARRVDGRAVQLLLRARARRTSTSTSTRSRSPRSGPSRSTSPRRTTGRSGGRRAQGLRRRRRDLARRPRRRATSASRSARPASTRSTT